MKRLYSTKLITGYWNALHHDASPDFHWQDEHSSINWYLKSVFFYVLKLTLVIHFSAKKILLYIVTDT